MGGAGARHEGSSRVVRHAAHRAGAHARRCDTATARGLGMLVRRLGVLAGSVGLCVCILCT